jgi:hypothetical protein
MMRFRIVVAAMACALLAACAFGSYEALILSEAVVLALGTASVAEADNQSAENPELLDRMTGNDVPEAYGIHYEGCSYWLDSENSGWSSRSLTVRQMNT